MPSRREALATAVGVLRRAMRRARRQDLALIGSGLTFYAALTIVPLALFALWGSSLLLGPDRVVGTLDGLAGYLAGPLDAEDVVRDLARIGPRLAIPSLIASLLTASLYGEGLLRAVESYEHGGPPRGVAWRGRILVIPYVLTLPLLSALALVAASALQELLGRGLGAQLLGIYLSFLLGWVLLTVQLSFIYRVFSVGRPALVAVVWGASAASSFLAGMSLGWIPVLRLGVDVGRAYGGSDLLGGLVLAMVYLLLFQLCMLGGQQLVVAIDDHRRGASGGDG